MKEEHLKKIILFYFFITLNEPLAKELGRKSWLWCQKKKSQDPTADPDKLVLLSLYSEWVSIKKQTRSGVSKYSLDSGWLFPKGVTLEPWKAFHKEATEEEIFITVLVGILKYPVDLIVASLGVSSGTIRYRLTKANRRMGKILPGAFP